MILTNDEIAMMTLTQGMMEEDAMRFRFEHEEKTKEEIAETEANKAKFQKQLKKQIQKEINK